MGAQVLQAWGCPQHCPWKGWHRTDLGTSWPFCSTCSHLGQAGPKQCLHGMLGPWAPICVTRTAAGPGDKDQHSRRPSAPQGKGTLCWALGGHSSVGSYGHGMQKVHLRVFPISGPCSGLPLLLGTAPAPSFLCIYIYKKKQFKGKSSRVWLLQETRKRCGSSVIFLGFGILNSCLLIIPWVSHMEMHLCTESERAASRNSSSVIFYDAVMPARCRLTSFSRAAGWQSAHPCQALK